MLKLGETIMIHQLRGEGLSIRAIARRTGLARKTVRKYLRRGLEEPAYGPRASRPTILDSYKEYVRGRLRRYPELTAQRLLREIRDLGYTGGYTTVKNYVREIREPARSGYEHRFETPPGRQGQVDFARFLVRFTSEPEQQRIVWLFSMVLGWSRYLYCRFVMRQDMSTVLRCHTEAFAALGGIPGQLLYDRMKTAVIREGADGRIEYNKFLLDLARHYGFVPRACPAYRAKTKGKVERSYRYIRQDFYVGREFRDMEDLNLQLDHWLSTIANRRIHGTTRRIVHEAYVEERPELLPLPDLPYQRVLRSERRVTHDGMVSVDGNLYSVPDSTRRRTVGVEMTTHEVVIKEGGHVVAVHAVQEGRGQRVVAPGHRQYPPPGRSKIRREKSTLIVVPGHKVSRRDLSAYEEIGRALAHSSGSS